MKLKLLLSWVLLMTILPVVVSSVGCQNQELRAGSNANLTVNLKSSQDLSKIVVTALGIKIIG